MKEEQRIALVRKIRKEKEQLRKLKGKAKRIEELKKEPAVIEYLELSQKIAKDYGTLDPKYASEETILSKYANKEKELNCEEKYLIRVGIGEKSKDGRFFRLDDFEGDTYYYTCLDCQRNFYIDKKDAPIFEQNKKIIEAEGTNIYEFNRIRKRYFELLMICPSEIAFQMLKEEIEQKYRARN